MKKMYNKLIRDNIPEILEEKGKKYSIKTLNDTEFLNCLNKKLIEEVNEYLEDNNVEELADIQEVLNTLTRIKGINKEEFEEIRKNKEKERGSFYKKYFLEYVEE